MKHKLITYLILIVMLLVTVAATFGPPNVLRVALKPNQTVIVSSLGYCDRLLIENLADLTVKVTCRVYMSPAR